MAKNEKGYGRDAKITYHLCPHTDQPLFANGLCQRCYHNGYEQKRYHRVKGSMPPNFYRRRSLLAKFGLTLEQYDEILVAQGGVCKICKRPPHGKHNLAVDHNHATGKLRGLLCGPCNTCLSHVERTSNFSKKGLIYLQENDK